MCSESDSSISTSLATERETLTGPCKLHACLARLCRRCQMLADMAAGVARRCGMHEDKRAGSRKHAGNAHVGGAWRAAGGGGGSACDGVGRA